MFANDVGARRGRQRPVLAETGSPGRVNCWGVQYYHPGLGVGGMAQSLNNDSEVVAKAEHKSRRTACQATAAGLSLIHISEPTRPY